MSIVKLLLVILILLAVIIIVIAIVYTKGNKKNIITTFIIKKIKLTGEIKKMEIQLDQKFKIRLKYLNDGGEPVGIENFTKIESTNPEAFEVVQLNPPEPNVYEFEVVGNMNGTAGAGFVNIDADVRFGEEIRIIPYTLPLLVTPDEAETLSAEIGEVEEQ